MNLRLKNVEKVNRLLSYIQVTREMRTRMDFFEYEFLRCKSFRSALERNCDKN